MPIHRNVVEEVSVRMVLAVNLNRGGQRPVGTG
jgi:hypothetical protein